MLRKEQLITMMVRENNAFLLNIPTSAYIMLGSNTLLSGSDFNKLPFRDRTYSDQGCQLLNLNNERNFLNLSSYVRKDTNSATMQLAEILAAWQLSETIAGIVITIDWQQLSNTHIQKLGEELATLFNHDAGLLQHCLFAFTGCTPIISDDIVADKLMQLQTQARDTLLAITERLEHLYEAEPSPEDLDIYLRQISELKEISREQQFLIEFIQRSRDCMQVLRDHSAVDKFLDELDKLVALPKKALAIESYCKTHYPHADYALVTANMPEILAACAGNADKNPNANSATSNLGFFDQSASAPLTLEEIKVQIENILKNNFS